MAHVHMRMWRTKNWKLVRDFLNPERNELYHLTEDPKETTNLIDSSVPEVQRAVRRLTAKIPAKMRTTEDPIFELAQRTDSSE